jgi:hypothetical protein
VTTQEILPILEAGAGCSQATTESMLEVVHANLRAEVPRWCVPYSERNTVSRRRASKSRRTRVDWRAIRACEDIPAQG